MNYVEMDHHRQYSYLTLIDQERIRIRFLLAPIKLGIDTAHHVTLGQVQRLTRNGVRVNGGDRK